MKRGNMVVGTARAIVGRGLLKVVITYARRVKCGEEPMRDFGSALLEIGRSKILRDM